MTRIHSYAIAVVLFFAKATAGAQAPGSIDLNFGNAGQVYTQFAQSSHAHAMEILPDDRILVAGIAETGPGIMALLARYLPDGDLDPSFGNEGKVQEELGGIYTSLNSMSVLDDGKILVAGKTHFDGRDHMVVARYESEGTLDATFGNGGITLLSITPSSGQVAKDMAVDGAGRIVVAGLCYIDTVPYAIMARLNADGTPDTGFGDGGFVVPAQSADGFLALVQFEAVRIQSDGKIVAAGFYGNPLNFTGWVARFLDDGSPDMSFGEAGASTVFIPGYDHLIYSISITPQGQIMLAGNFVSLDTPGSVYLLMRMQADGSIDNSFGAGGFSTPEVVLGGSFGRAVMVPGGSSSPTLVAGSSGGAFSTLRVNAAGQLDSDFGWDGIAITYVTDGFGRITAMGRQSDGKLVCAGFRFDSFLQTHRVALLRYHMESTLDVSQTAMDATGMRVYPNPGTGSYHIDLPHGFRAVQYLLYTSGGQPAATLPASEAAQRLDIGHLPQGLYHLVASDAQGNVLRCKVVKM